MRKLYSITTNQEAIIRLFRVVNRYVGNLAPMPAVFPDYPAPVTQRRKRHRAGDDALGMPPPPKIGGPPVTNIRNVSQPQRAACSRNPHEREQLEARHGRE